MATGTYIYDGIRISNVSSLVIRAASDGRQLSLGRNDSCTERIQIDLPIGRSSWPNNDHTETGHAQGLQESPNTNSSDELCYGFPLHVCNDHGACIGGRCECDVGYLGDNCTYRATCQQWSVVSASYTSQGCVVLNTSASNVLCECDSVASDVAVLRQDVTVPLEVFGCLDTAALTFDPQADVHDQDGCAYASPPPPLILRDLIGFYCSFLATGWITLWLVTAMFVQAIDTYRIASGTRNFHIKPPRTIRTSLLRRWLRQLWFHHGFTWVLHPWDFTRHTRYRHNLPQALLLCTMPVFALSVLLSGIYELCRRHASRPLAWKRAYPDRASQGLPCRGCARGTSCLAPPLHRHLP